MILLPAETLSRKLFTKHKSWQEARDRGQSRGKPNMTDSLQEGKISRLVYILCPLKNGFIYMGMCVSIGTLEIINFPFVPHGKLLILVVPKSILQPNYDVLKYWGT